MSHRSQFSSTLPRAPCDAVTLAVHPIIFPVELKNILARQPGPEVAEQLSIYQQGLRDKTKSMKAMASELNMYQAQVCSSQLEMFVNV